MKNTPDINEYIRSLIASEQLGPFVVHHAELPACPEKRAEPAKPWPDEIRGILSSMGIPGLYSHQARAIDLIREGGHVVAATPTASGKSLIYNLPLLEMVSNNPDKTALYLSPLKALAQDQLRALNGMIDNSGIEASAAIYDGDTTAWNRKKIRDAPPNAIMTNPEMVHLSLLAHHSKWKSFLANLGLVIVDEVHTYRGILGSHMAQVFRRFQRICALYGAAPSYVFCSATIADPAGLARQLTGLTASQVSESGAPRGKKHLVFLNTHDGGIGTSIKLLKAALHRELRTIVYTRSRKLTELMAIWAGKRSGRFAGRIGSYRAGFLPEERRKIEQQLSNGELLAVISTSALELGIDIGDLDLCLLVGYPGSVAATWQRGGRVGRGGQDSALVLIAGQDALDQYFMRNPDDFLNRRPEAAVVNPYNPKIASLHLVCAAAESPLSADEPILAHPAIQKAVALLEAKGRLLRSKDGKTLYANRKAPHRRVDLRGAGDRYRIISADTDKTIGEIDGFRVFKETHPGAVYLHDGVTYRVDALDTETKTVKASRARVNYYTKIRSEDAVDILETSKSESVWGTVFHAGHIRVTDHVVGYEQWRIRGRQRLNYIPLDLPPQVFETEGVWFEIPRALEVRLRNNHMDVLGGIHAIEHGAIGIFPLLVMADRNDLGGLAAEFQPQIGSPVIFIYDGIPGGAGLTHEAFHRARALLEFTIKTIGSCPCETGCPSCVHSPKCGSGNRPIDKAAALFILHAIKTGPKMAVSPPSPVPDETPEPGKTGGNTRPAIHFGVLDLETQRSAREVGGWLRADRMGVSCVVVYDSKMDDYLEFTEEQVPELVDYIKTLELIVGFNIKRFDYLVLTGYSDFPFDTLPTLDLLERVYTCLGFRLSLDRLAQVTLGAQKSADGLQALRWWKQGRLREIIDYCRKDVEITRDLYLFGRDNGHLLFKNKEGRIHRIPADWRES